MSFSLDRAALVHPNGHPALRGVTLAAHAGERLAVVGPSGAGKTSLLRVLGTSLRPTGGTVGLLGADPWSLSARALKALRARIGSVHQAPPIPPRLRVVTAVLAGRLGRWSTAQALASLLLPRDLDDAREALDRLGLADRLFDRCDRLSGGQLQRVGIARVLVQSPDLLLADEPVSALDPTLADAAIGVLVAQAEATGATLVASLHAVELALRWFPRIVGLRGGAVAFDLPAAAVTPDVLRALYATAGVAPAPSSAATVGDAVGDAVARPAGTMPPAGSPEAAEAAWMADDDSNDDARPVAPPRARTVGCG